MPRTFLPVLLSAFVLGAGVAQAACGIETAPASAMRYPPTPHRLVLNVDWDDVPDICGVTDAWACEADWHDPTVLWAREAALSANGYRDEARAAIAFAGQYADASVIIMPQVGWHISQRCYDALLWNHEVWHGPPNFWRHATAHQ